MTSKQTATWISAIATTLLSGCGHLSTNTQPSLYGSEVKPVVTEHSLALECLGDLIDAGDKPPVTVYITDIKDQTVPYRYRERRLSRGGAWWLHTAIVKLRSTRVASTLKSPTRKNIGDRNHLVLSGAWTQDDVEVGQSKRGLDLDNDGGGHFKVFDWQKDRHMSVIAGDFVTTVDDVVAHASAISLAIGGRRDGFDLRIDDGARSLDVGVISAVNEGPQFAQRRIAEAAVLVHVARAFDIDYRPCISEKGSNSGNYREQMRAYIAALPHQQFRQTQEALLSAGYDPGEIDGVWGERSRKALMLFQSANDVPITGIPSPELFGLLLGAASRQ